MVYLKLNEEQQLIYDYEPQPEPVYTDLQIIMQGLSDLELAIKEGFVVYLKLNEEQQLIYDYEPQPEPVYTDLQIIMQGLSDLELAILEGGM